MPFIFGARQGSGTSPSFCYPARCGSIVRELRKVVSTPSEILVACCGSSDLVRLVRDAYGNNVEICAIDKSAKRKRQALKSGADAYWSGHWVDFIKLEGAFPGALLMLDPMSIPAVRELRATLDELLPQCHLAALLPLSYLSDPRKHRELWLRRDLRFFMPIVGRPSVVPGATPPQEHGLYIWESGYEGQAVLGAPLIVEDAPAIDVPGRHATFRQEGSGTQWTACSVNGARQP